MDMSYILPLLRLFAEQFKLSMPAPQVPELYFITKNFREPALRGVHQHALHQFTQRTEEEFSGVIELTQFCSLNYCYEMLAKPMSKPW